MAQGHSQMSGTEDPEQVLAVCLFKRKCLLPPNTHLPPDCEYRDLTLSSFASSSSSLGPVLHVVPCAQVLPPFFPLPHLACTSPCPLISLCACAHPSPFGVWLPEQGREFLQKGTLPLGLGLPGSEGTGKGQQTRARPPLCPHLGP